MSYNLSRRVARNKFNLSETNALSCRMGDLVPIYVRHMIPGDTFNMNSHISARFAPMQAPIMSQVDIKTWSFFVPYRIIWDESQEFFTGKDKRTGEAVEPVFPRTKFGSSAESTNVSSRILPLLRTGELADYLDFPIERINPADPESQNFASYLRYCPNYSMLEPRGYQMIFNEYFRDQNIDNAVEFGTDSYIYDFGSTRAVDEYVNLMTIRKKRWQKDVFTSALPTPSLAEDVEIPINAEVVLNRSDNVASNQGRFVNDGGVIQPGDISQRADGRILSGSATVNFDPNGTLDVLNSGATIRELTRSRMLYQYLLDVARGGATRYKDWVKTLFNVNTADSRLQRPEYIGGGSQPVIISDVVQTSETADTAQGNLSGRAVAVGSTPHYSSYTATEHGFVMTIMCIMPQPMYSQGMPKRHFMFDRFDHFIPQFDHIGDEEIKSLELYDTPYYAGAPGTLPEINDGSRTFGYAPRYYDYKSSINRVHGKFKSDLAYWTMARIFNGPPSLSPEFLVADDSTLDRPFFVLNTDETEADTEQCYVEINTVVDAYRPMSKLSTPIV